MKQNNSCNSFVKKNFGGRRVCLLTDKSRFKINYPFSMKKYDTDHLRGGVETALKQMR